MADHRGSDSTSDVLASYRARGLAGRVGFGKRPAVVVVDFIVGFTDPEAPLGAPMDEAVEATARLLEAARRSGVPVVFATTVYETDLADAGIFPCKVPALRTLIRGSRYARIDSRLGPEAGDLVIEKRYASAFFGTHLAATLTAMGIDTVVVTGCTTSGCVRATVVDALQNGFRAVVPRECVADRAASQHEASLLDIDGKYGDVVFLAETMRHLARAAPPLRGTRGQSRAKRIHHLDVVVRDLDEAAARYAGILGVQKPPRESLPQRGIELVRFRVGETWLILVSPTGSTGPVAEHLAKHGEGFFHVALAVDDLDAAVARAVEAGARLEGGQPRRGLEGWKLADLKATDTFGAMIQLVEEEGCP